jgi:hypothetical protein
MHVLLALRACGCRKPLSGSEMHPTPEQPPRESWLIKSLIAGAMTAAMVAMVFCFPTWWLTWCLVAGVGVFVWMSFHHPDHWHRRMAASMLAAAVGLSVLPMLKASGELKNIGWFSIAVDNSSWVAGLCVVAAIVAMIIDRTTRHGHPHRQEANEPPPEPSQSTHQPSQQQPMRPIAHPAYTGVVDAEVFGHPWRARMLAGKAMDAKPFCLRHRVPLRPLPGGTDWRCPQEACGYYQYHPKLAFMASDKREFLTAVYNLIEQRVREGVGYTICPDDESSHI